MSANDYSTFGAPMAGRTFTSNSYRYGFNGKENDPESVSTGEGLQDYGFRIYNPSLGKFLSVDPLTKKYPELTPYQFASNTPIWAIDLDGLEGVVRSVVQWYDSDGDLQENWRETPALMLTEGTTQTWYTAPDGTTTAHPNKNTTNPFKYSLSQKNEAIVPENGNRFFLLEN